MHLASPIALDEAENAVPEAAAPAE